MAKTYKISEVCGDWALHIPPYGKMDEEMILIFNSRNNAELVKSVLEWEDAHPNAAVPYMPTLTPPNEPLTWDELGTMIEKPVYIVEMENGKSYWALVYTVSDTGTLLASAIDLNDYGSRKLYGKSWLAYRHPPEGDEDT
ncbi:MAG TPA: hypothetical protein H9707_09585 [Candidatus Butyricicoccus avicola]|nr:hypothetical protein [Candidatus Butyricicoccus avicola]